MQIANTNVFAKVAAVIAGLGLVFSSFAYAIPAKAATTAELEAQIAALMAQIQAMSGSTTSSASVTFSKDLTLGSSGADVTALQNWLIKGGYSIAAGATGYFGAQTQAALAKYQAAVGITPAAGYFGPVTRAKVNAAGGSSTGGSTGGSTSSGDLEGGAGSIDSYKLISSINNEEVGEDEEDQDVFGLEIEASDDSDIEIRAVRLVFNEGTAASDFEDYASEVSIMLDGEEFARVDADEFNDDNNWTKTVTLDSGAIIRSGDTAELTVAVSGANVIDSGDLGDTWTLDVPSVRFVDAQDATITEDPNVSTRTFSFTSFASASNVELKIAEDDQDINDARTIQVDATDDTEDEDVLSFTLEAEGDSDLDIKNWGVSVTVTGASNTDDVISGLSLWIDGEEVATADTVSTGGATEFYNFDDVDYTINAGDTAEVVVKADFLSIADALSEGDTISFALGEEQTDTTTIDVEDESGENLADADITGSVTSGAFELRSKGIMVTFVSASESVVDGGSNAYDGTGTFNVVFNVEAFGDTVYVSKTAAATTASTILDSTVATDGNLYLVDNGGTATVVGLSDAVSFTTSGGATSASSNNIALGDGEDTDITLTVTRTNSLSGHAGLYRLLLKSVGWATTDTTTWNVYDFNLEDFKTDSVSIN
ncbi:MAG: peptidoglycan-binding protein [Candidatus Pacebacteria bacterium]|nr:peptidoglycan-binding protein [Candidatus Paceibacterota bacterium]